jgi:L-ribulose-5-phosphate 3-epimerase
MKSYKLGVMQGRLLPKYKGRYQAHPLGYWQDEFSLAKGFELNQIEFILDFNDCMLNPLLREGGLEEIQTISKKTGIKVKTICADYFMEAPVHSSDSAIAKKSQMVLINLLGNATKLGVTDIVIPCVDQSSLGGIDATNRFIKKMEPIVDIAESLDLNLSLETDLPPKPFLELINQFQSKNVTINYDLGNSASLGFNLTEELDTYGDKITDIHIKDRVLDGGPVMLGEGSVDFNKFFKKIKEFDFNGPFIMQAFRDDEGLNVFKNQLSWIKPYLEDL